MVLDASEILGTGEAQGQQAMGACLQREMVCVRKLHPPGLTHPCLW